jgi:DNA-binding Lrp family transcriptional regulator
MTQCILRDVRTAAPPLLPIFRSQLQGELLAAALLSPDAEQSLTDLAERLGASLATVQREVHRLEEAGILRSRRVGNTRLVSAETTSPVFSPLAELVLRSFGPAEVVRAEFDNIPGIDELYLFGSWAARYEGEAGRAPADIDVLVIGRPNRDEVYEAALRAEQRLHRPVNTTIRSRAAWSKSDDGFLSQVRSSPLVAIRSATTRGVP